MFQRCRSCKTLTLLDAGSGVEAATHLYEGGRYFTNPTFDDDAHGGFYGYKDYLSDRTHIEEKFASILERVEQWVPPGELLDVGAGPGFLLVAGSSRGWRGVGVDVNPWAVDYARDNVGADVRLSSLHEAAFDPESFDLVTMMDVIEHLPDPESVIAELARVTRDGGVAVIVTANAGSPVSRLLQSRWPEARRVPEHVVLFSVDGLSRMLERHGFEPLTWHSVGKKSTIETLLSDIGPVAPAPLAALRRALAGRRVSRWTFYLDPKTKFCLYARRRPRGDG